MVGPIGGPTGPGGTAGPNKPIFPPGSPEDTIGQALLETSTLTNPLPSKPSLFPPISGLADIIGILDKFRQELNLSDTQQAAMMRDVHKTIAEAALSAAERFRKSSEQFSDHVAANNALFQANETMSTSVNIENASLSDEANLALAMNQAVDNYNSAAANYQTLLNTPGTPPASLSAAYSAMQLQITFVNIQKTTYNAFVSIRNIGIAQYNTARNNYSTSIDDISQQYVDINNKRAFVGLPPYNFPNLAPPNAKQSMESFNDPLSLNVSQGQQPIFIDTNSKVADRTSQLVIFIPPFPPLPNFLDFFNSFLNLLSSILSGTSTMKRNTEFSSNVFDFFYFKLRTKLDSSIIESITERLPPPPSQQKSNPSPNQAISTPGSSILLASQSAGLSNKDLESVLSDGILKSFSQRSGAPLSADIIKLLQLLIAKLFSLESLAGVKSSVARLGANGLNLAGNSQTAQVANAISTLENVLQSVATENIKGPVGTLLNSDQTLSPDQVQNLLDPTVAALNFSLILLALNNLGRTLGGPALAGDLLQAVFANDPNLGELFQISNATTTDDVVRNALTQLFLTEALTGDIARVTGLSRAEASRIASKVFVQIEGEGNLTQAELTQAIQNALVAAGVQEGDSAAIAENLAQRVISETDLSNQLQNIQLDSIIQSDQINQDAILESIQKNILDTTTRISDALTEAAEESGAASERLAAASLIEAILRKHLQPEAQLARELRENIINDLQAQGVTLSQASSIANQVIVAVDAQQQSSNLLKLAESGQSVDQVRDNIRNLLLSATRADLGNRSVDLADHLDKVLFGPTQILPEREKGEIRNPVSVVNQVRDQATRLVQLEDSGVNDGITEAVRKASNDNFDITAMQQKLTDPGTMLTHSILTGLSGTDAALPHNAAGKPATPIGKNIDIPA